MGILVYISGSISGPDTLSSRFSSTKRLGRKASSVLLRGHWPWISGESWEAVNDVLTELLNFNVCSGVLMSVSSNSFGS